MPLLNLQEELEVRRADAGADYLERIAAAAEVLTRACVTRGVRRVGERAPDFALASGAGPLVSLSGLLRSGPVAISFYRGEWCPFCKAELDALLAAQPAIARLGASLLLVSSEPASAALVADVARLGPQVHLLHDPMLGVALRYGLVYLVPDVLQAHYRSRNFDLSRRLSTGSWLLPLPGDFLIDPQGRIALSFTETDFTRRLDPKLIVEALSDMLD